MSKVAVVRCENYDVNEVYDALKKGIKLIGGVEKFISTDEKVLLKPNLLTSASPKKAVTTHPAVFEATIRIFKENGYNVSYGDSPGVGSPEKVSLKCDLKSAADRYEVPLSDFVKGKTVTYVEGRQTKQFEIANAALEADAIVSICKMKSHQLTKITGAIKNQLGCVYGLNKASTHAKFPDVISYSKMLVDLNMFLKPRLYIMDGILAMEGNGPHSGDPVWMNVLLVSDDPVALDSVFCRLVYLDPEFVPTITYGEEFGLGKWRDEDIEIVGEELKELINKEFNIARKPVKPENIRMAPFLRNRILRKPIIDNKKCIKCGICVEACPVEDKALKFENGQKEVPVFNYNKCIRCYCCQEMCPKKSIQVKTPLLGKVLLYR